MPKWRDKVTPGQPGDKNAELEAVLLINGTRPDGEAQWAYVKMLAVHVPVFKYFEAQGNYDLGNPEVLGPNGEVLAHGLGDTPPKEITEKLKQTYDLNEHTEQELTNAVAEMLSESPLFKTLTKQKTEE